MLPSPATAKFRQRHRKLKPLDFLLSRSRITNLAFFLLSFITIISLFYNARYLSCPSLEYSSSSQLLSTISRDAETESLNHLIIVPGHAIWNGTDPELRLHEDQWVLQPYQSGGDRVSAFFAHIFRGAELARADENSLLIFSGGQTRLTSTTTEAESYMRLALATDVFHTLGSPHPLFKRATTEDHALDSYQNFLFSIARFHEFTGKYPSKITIVGYEFKRARFTELHRAALRWPSNKFHYIGVDPSSDHSAVAEEGEKNNGYIPFTKDLYGCRSFLLSKRRKRNPFIRFHSYFQTSLELRELLDWCPSTSSDTNIFTGNLPWDNF